MINAEEIRAEIESLKAQETTYRNCEKLAVLTTVLAYLERSESHASRFDSYSFSAGDESEFISAARSAGMDSLLSVMDEHMEELKLVYPKEYARIIRLLSQ